MSEQDDLVSLDDLPVWRHALETCPACGNTHVSVFPITATRLECPCGHWNPAPPLPHEPSRRDLAR